MEFGSSAVIHATLASKGSVELLPVSCSAHDAPYRGVKDVVLGSLACNP